MTMAVGKIQAAIWRTEEAIELQRLRISEAKDPRIVEIERNSLITLEDVLDIHRRTLDFLLRIPEASAQQPQMREMSQSVH